MNDVEKTRLLVGINIHRDGCKMLEGAIKYFLGSDVRVITEYEYLGDPEKDSAPWLEVLALIEAQDAK